MLFQPKEHGSIGPSGEYRIPVWSRLKLELEERGWEPYITGIFHAADTIAEEFSPLDVRESELQQLPEKDFQSKKLTYRMVQMAPLALVNHLHNPERPTDPIYIGVTFTFTHDLLGNHTMRIQGQEETYNGPVPDKFLLPQDGGDQAFHDAIIQAMLRPRDFTHRRKTTGKKSLHK